MAWSWDTTQGGAATPSFWAICSTALRGKVFYKGSTVSIALSQATATAYEVLDYWGNVVASGSVSGTTLNLGTYNSCGWYRFYLTRGTSASPWGTACGDGMFCVIRSDSRFVTMPAWGTAGGVSGQDYPADEVLRGVMILGPERYRIDLPAGVGASGTYHAPGVSNLVTNITKNYYLKSDKLDSARPRPLLVAFPENTNTTDIADEITTVVGNLTSAHSDVEWWFEGPYNEPNNNEAPSTAAAKMETFYNAVKAGSASAKVLGPNTVTYNATSLGWLDTFLSTASGFLDGVSWHAYNSSDGDLALRRKCDAELTTILTNRGVSSLPRWMTEHGEFCAAWGVGLHRVQAHREMFEMLMNDQLGVPKERNHHWYLRQIGFWGYPAFHQTEDDDLFPILPILRTFAEEVYGKTYTAALDFGSPGNDILLGNRYTNAGTGDQVWCLMDAGATGQVTLTFYTATPQLTKVDAWGNESTINVTKRRFTLTVSELPTYIRVPSGTTLQFDKLDWNENPIQKAPQVVTASAGASTKTTLVNNDVLENQLYDAAPPRLDHASTPWWVESPSGATLTIPFQRDNTIDTVVIWCPPPRQDNGTLLDFDVKTRNTDGTYTTRATITRTPLVKTFTSSQRTMACYYESYFDDRHIFVVSLGAEHVTRGVQLVIRDATYGGMPNSATQTRHSEATFDASYVDAWGRLQVETPSATPNTPICGIQEVRAYRVGNNRRLIVKA